MFIKTAKKIPTTVYDLEWTCPMCREKNFEYHFTDWKYKSRFFCGKCRKTVWLPPEETIKTKEQDK